MDTKQKIEKYVDDWVTKCYKNGIPDEVESIISDKVPNWKSIAICILKNDLNLYGLGFSVKKSNYYNILKRIEIDARTYEGKQLKFF